MDARKALLDDDFASSLHMEDYSQRAYMDTIESTPHLSDDTPQEARRREIAWLNIRWFMMTLLNRMDRASMYSGLEARVPFADHRILDYVYSMPDSVLYRKKSPYPKTYDPAYEQLLADRLLEMVNETNSPLTGIIDKKKLSHFLHTPSDYGKPWYGQLMAGPQMLAYFLQVGYWIRNYSISL